MAGDRVTVQAHLSPELYGALYKGVPWGSRNALYQKVFEEIARVCQKDERVATLILSGNFRIEIEFGDN